MDFGVVVRTYVSEPSIEWVFHYAGDEELTSRPSTHLLAKIGSRAGPSAP